MKKTKDGDLEYITLEEGDDFELFQKTFGLVLYRIDNTLYCVNHNECFALLLLKDSNEWVLIDYDEVPYIEDSLSEEEANEAWKKTPPFDAIVKYKKEKAEKKLAYWAEQRKNTKRKVIGWVDPYEQPKFGKQTDDKIAALINDIAEHDYFFGGDDIEIVPMFDDGTCLDFSSSGWGEIQALANGMGGDYDYSMYKNASMLNPPFRKPKEGKYK